MGEWVSYSDTLHSCWATSAGKGGGGGEGGTYLRTYVPMVHHVCVFTWLLHPAPHLLGQTGCVCTVCLLRDSVECCH